MRRISFLGIVLLISVSANASVQIGVNGDMFPPEIDLFPSDEAIVSIWTDTGLMWPNFYGIGILEGEPGSLYYDWQPPHILIAPDPEPPAPPGFSSWIWLFFDGIEPVPPGTILADGINFHCEGLGSVDLRLYESPDFTELLLDDIVRINQIPEPTTIAILGFGAMLLKRRRQ